MSANAPRAPTPVRGRRPVLVTGGAGFIGSNLADRLAREGHDVVVFDALTRPGVEANLEWLKAEHPRRLTSVIADVRDADAVDGVVRDASAVFHFAAQVAVTSSLAAPDHDFEVNARGTLLLLEALRCSPRRTPLVFASTNKVYGDLGDVALCCDTHGYEPQDSALREHGVSENRPLAFHTPYGCSKGSADQYVLDYARSFDVPAAVLRMSCIYGPRQFGTEDQGWVAHFLLRALADEPVTIYGDGFQVRDVLDVSDAVDAYLSAWARIEAIKGTAFNLGGGPENAVSLRQVVAHIERLTGRTMRCLYRDWRPGDQRYYVSDIRRVQSALGLHRPRAWTEGIAALARWLQGHARKSTARAASAQMAVAVP